MRYNGLSCILLVLSPEMWLQRQKWDSRASRGGGDGVLVNPHILGCHPKGLYPRNEGESEINQP